MIQIQNIKKSFGSKAVLDNLSLEIKDGSVFGLVGVNGAGKSTLLRLISGVYNADAGEILIDGKNVFENSKIKKDIFFLPDEPFYDLTTTPQNLKDIYKCFYDLNEDTYFSCLKKFNIPIKQTIKNFSKGMKRQVFVALALAISPKYLLLDEAFDGLDPLARLEFRKELAKLLSDKNITVIISSHSLRELSDICDSYALLDNKIISENGIINDDIHKYHKYQMAFKENIKKEDFNFDIKKIEIEGHIVRLVTTLNIEELEEKTSNLNPLVIDEIKIDFEELFMIEVNERGDLNA